MSDSNQGTGNGDIIEQLTDADILRAGADDLELTGRFSGDWNRRIEQLGEDGPEEYLALLLQVHPDELIVEDGPGVSVTRNGRQVGEWPSETALVADVAAATLLREQVPGWEELDPTVRDELIARLRLFLEDCPDCGGVLSQEPAAVEDRLVAYVCTDCDTQLV